MKTISVGDKKIKKRFLFFPLYFWRKQDEILERYWLETVELTYTRCYSNGYNDIFWNLIDVKKVINHES